MQLTETLTLSVDEWRTLHNGLCIAATKLEKNAFMCIADGYPKLAEVFRRQAEQTSEVADTVHEILMREGI